MNKPYDAIVVGSGPAGSTAACGLAQRGRRVIVLDRESFPRYAVGESMLPFCYFPLREIGMLEKMKASTFVNKCSVQFVREDGRVSAPFYFVDHMHHEAGKTWQVERSEFDAMLLDHARESGAEVRTGVTVTDLLRNEGGAVTGVRARDDEGDFELHAPITVDASGQHSFAATRLGWRIMDQNRKRSRFGPITKGRCAI
ncbi:MAG: NAD(P)/FAD-dependent oxidoreductase, partial [Lentisphaeria bacterium]|nr:NAD(P)/FAD-dependent oxidoreductase [Lentisphaeria bacterium]